MAKVRDIDLKRRILAKLMLLEYFKPESFRVLYRRCTEEKGAISDLKLLEKKEKMEFEHDIVERWRVWVDDSWLWNWLKLEPSFIDVDLRPYYSFSRDRLDDITGYLGKVSPYAQEFLQKLLNDSAAVRATALKTASILNESDAAAVLEAISTRIQQTDDVLADSPLLDAQFGLCSERKDLVGQLVSFWAGMPEEAIPFGIVPRLATVAKGTASESAANAIIVRWSTNTKNKKLSTAAQRHLEGKF